MVTTIKITCDGVFIQSNSYNNYNEPRTQTAITEISSSSQITTSSSTTISTNKPVTTVAEKDKSTVDSINNKCNPTTITTTTTGIPATQLSVCRTTRSRSNSSCNSNNNCIVDNGISCQIRSDCRKRYYFGSNGNNNNNNNNNGIYWCKNSAICANSKSKGTHNRTRSSPKGLSSEYLAGCNNNKDFVHICDKFPRNFVTSKSIILSKSPTNTVSGEVAARPLPFFGNSLKSNLIHTQIHHRSKFHTDSSLLSFLRDISARHFSRTEIERGRQLNSGQLKDNTDNSIMLKLRSTLLTTIIDRFPTIIPSTTTTTATTTTTTPPITNSVTTTTTDTATATTTTTISSRNSIDSQAKICNDWFG